MESIFKSDIFFVVTTVVVLCIGLLLGWVLVYLIRILSDVKKISKKVGEEGERIVGDIGDLREHVKKNTIRLADILSFSFFRSKSRRKSKIINEDEQ